MYNPRDNRTDSELDRSPYDRAYVYQLLLQWRNASGETIEPGREGAIGQGTWNRLWFRNQTDLDTFTSVFRAAGCVVERIV